MFSVQEGPFDGHSLAAPKLDPRAVNTKVYAAFPWTCKIQSNRGIGLYSQRELVSKAFVSFQSFDIGTVRESATTKASL